MPIFANYQVEMICSVLFLFNKNFYLSSDFAWFCLYLVLNVSSPILKYVEVWLSIPTCLLRFTPDHKLQILGNDLTASASAHRF